MFPARRDAVRSSSRQLGAGLVGPASIFEIGTRPDAHSGLTISHAATAFFTTTSRKIATTNVVIADQPSAGVAGPWRLWPSGRSATRCAFS